MDGEVEKKPNDPARYYAEKLVTEEYECIVVLMYDKNKNVHSWYKGNSVAALGLLDYGKEFVRGGIQATDNLWEE